MLMETRNALIEKRAKSNTTTNYHGNNNSMTPSFRPPTSETIATTAKPAATATDLPRQYNNPNRKANTIQTTDDPKPDNEDNNTDEDEDDTHLTALINTLQALQAPSNSTHFANHCRTVMIDTENMQRVANLANGDGTYYAIADGGADTSIIGRGWMIVERTARKADVTGFDPLYA